MNKQRSFPKLLSDIAQNLQPTSKINSSRRDSSAEPRAVTESSSSSKTLTPKKSRIKFQLHSSAKQNTDRSMNSSLTTAINSRSRSTGRLIANRNLSESKLSSFSRDLSRERLRTQESTSDKFDINSIVREIIPSKKLSAESNASKKRPHLYLVFRKNPSPEVNTEPTLKNLSKMVEEIIYVENLFRANPDYVKEEVYECFQRLHSTSISVRLCPLILKILELYSKISKAYGDSSKAIQLLKQYKSICTLYSADSQKLRCYRWIAQTCAERHEYDRALIFAKKQLTLSWKLDDANYEILAYDFMGLQHYYKGNLDLAKYFHRRMTRGVTEPKTSNFRRIAINSIENSYIRKQVQALTSYKEEDNFKLYFSSGEEDIDLPFDGKSDSMEGASDDPVAQKSMKELRDKKLKDEKKVEIAVQRALFKEKYSGNKAHDPLQGDNIFGKKPLIVQKGGRKAFYTNLGPDKKDLDKWIVHYVSNKKNQVGSMKMNDEIRVNHLGINKSLSNFHLMDRPGMGLNEAKVHSYSLDGKRKAKILKLLAKCRNELIQHINYIKGINSENIRKVDAVEKISRSKKKNFFSMHQESFMRLLTNTEPDEQ